jgi:hypothetical protein
MNTKGLNNFSRVLLGIGVILYLIVSFTASTTQSVEDHFAVKYLTKGTLWHYLNLYQYVGYIAAIALIVIGLIIFIITKINQKKTK